MSVIPSCALAGRYWLPSNIIFIRLLKKLSLFRLINFLFLRTFCKFTRLKLFVGRNLFILSDTFGTPNDKNYDRKESKKLIFFSFMECKIPNNKMRSIHL